MLAGASIGGRALARALRYAIPLLRETFGYLWRLAAHAAGVLRIWWLSRDGGGTHPSASLRIAAIRDRRQARWTAWRALSVRRRVEVRLAAAALAGAALAALHVTLSPAAEAPHLDPPPYAVALPDPEAARADADASLVARERAARFARMRADASMGTWLRFDGVVLEPGQLHAWDDFKAGSPTVVIEDSGSRLPFSPRRTRFRLWYRGCRFIADEYSCGIGLAESADGVQWEKRPEPVFEPEDPLLSERLHALAVLKHDGRYLMWYSAAAGFSAGQPRSTLYLAGSDDGVRWEPKGRVLESVQQDTMRPIEPAVLHDGSRFHLWHVDRPAPDADRALVHLTSPDGAVWERAGDTPIAALDTDPGRLAVRTTADGFHAHFAHPFNRQSTTRIIGALHSPDGSVWTRLEDEAVPDTTAADREIASLPSSAAGPGGLWLYLTVRRRTGSEAIGLLFRKEDSR